MSGKHSIVEQAQAIINIYKVDKTCYILNTTVGQDKAMEILTEGFNELLKKQGETE
jgi:hypothetical protein